MAVSGGRTSGGNALESSQGPLLLSLLPASPKSLLIALKENGRAAPLVTSARPAWQLWQDHPPSLASKIEQFQAIKRRNCAAMTTQERLLLLFVLSPLSLSPIYVSARYCNVQNYVCVSNR